MMGLDLMSTVINVVQTFQWPEGFDSTLAPNIVVQSAGFNGRIAFDMLPSRLAKHEAAASATAAILPATPTLGTVEFSGDRLTVLVPVSSLTADTTFVLTITVTSTDGDIVTLSGTIKVE